MGDEFTYQLCGNCGSMQLAEAIPDLSRYYPQEDYYSFNMEMNRPEKPDLLTRVKASYLLYGKNAFIGKLLSIGYKIPDFYDWVIHTRVQLNEAILDVGCGNGSLLNRYFKMGFRNLTGIDPFLDKDHIYPSIRLLKKDIYALDQRFDLIMMHHSLEHMAEPLKALQKARVLLNDDKYLLVRIPIMGNYGWQKYTTKWCGIDAPRHLFIPSERGMRLLAEQAGFSVVEFIYDSSDYVIWSSEQYLRDIPLHAPNSRMINKKKSVFTKAQIRAFKRTIAEENKKNNGDTAAFYLKKK